MKADKQAGCKSAHEMFNTLSMTEHSTFTKLQSCYQREAAKTLRGEILILRPMCKCVRLNKQEELHGWLHIWHH